MVGLGEVGGGPALRRSGAWGLPNRKKSGGPEGPPRNYLTEIVRTLTCLPILSAVSMECLVPRDTPSHKA